MPETLIHTALSCLYALAIAIAIAKTYCIFGWTSSLRIQERGIINYWIEHFNGQNS
jgi:hypothetical protein